MRRELAREVDARLLHELDEAVELARHDEGVDRIREDDEFSERERLERPREVALEALNLRADIEDAEGVLRKALREVDWGLERDAVFPFR